MKKILASILALTMIFSLVGGIPSFAEEMNDSFAGRNYMVNFLEAFTDLFESSKDLISPNCLDEFLKKRDFFSSVVSRSDFYDIDKKDLENIKRDTCNIEREFWIACKDDRLPGAVHDYLEDFHDFMNEDYNCPVEKTSLLEKIMDFFGLANRNEL